MAKRLLRITSYTGHARYLATLEDAIAGYIPKQSDIPSPYAYSPTHSVWTDPKRGLVFIVETSHKRYDVFAVGSIPMFSSDDDAMNVYLESRKAVR